MLEELDTTRELLSRQLDAAIETDALGTLPVLAALSRQTDEQLRDAVRRAAGSSSWSQIAAALGVSKQAAHQRFRVYAKDVAGEIREARAAARQARRGGDADQARRERERIEDLAAGLRRSVRELKDRG